MATTISFVVGKGSLVHTRKGVISNTYALFE